MKLNLSGDGSKLDASNLVTPGVCDQHVNMVNTLHGHQELCSYNKHLLRLLSLLTVQQSFLVMTGSNLTGLAPSLSEPTSSVPVIDPKFTAEKLVRSHFYSYEGSPDFYGKQVFLPLLFPQTWGQLGLPPSPLLDMSLFDIMSHDP